MHHNIRAYTSPYNALFVCYKGRPRTVDIQIYHNQADSENRMCTLRACGNLCLSNVTDMAEKYCDIYHSWHSCHGFLLKLFSRCDNNQFIILRPEKSGLKKIPCILAEIKTNCPESGRVLTEKRKKRRQESNTRNTYLAISLAKLGLVTALKHRVQRSFV